VAVASEGGGSARTARRLATGALTALIVLLVLLVGAGVFAAQRLHTTARDRYVGEAFPLRVTERDLVLQMLNEQTGVRGYVITSDPSSLAPYLRGRENVALDLARLERLAADRPFLSSRIADVHAEVRRVETYFAQQIALVRRGLAGRAEARANVLVGKAGFDRFHAAADRLDEAIDTLVRSAEAQQRRTYRRAVAFLATTGAAAGLLALALLLGVPARLERLYRREHEARVTAERGAQASRALAHVREAVVLADEEDAIRYWNAAAESVFGVSENDAIGRTVGSVVPELAAAGGAARLVPVGSDGRERWLAVTTTGFPEGRVIVLRDVTDEHQLERIRDDFVATAAHELRTPIASVYGAVRTLRRGDVALEPETAERFLAMIETESDRLGRIVDQIVTSAQLGRGELTLAAGDCDLRAVCESVVAAVEPWRPENVTLSLAGDAELPVRCDDGRLRQALLNVTENAVKYSPDGGHVELRLADGPDRVRIDVRDEGIGVPNAERDRIFEKFYRLDPSMSRGVGGSGLGLYISRQLIEQMGGTIDVAANPGGGSVFTVELPRA
jgi:two-component system phosphate regulon sensor histidine kinase PhoR